MAKNTLPEDFKDDILAESMNGRRRYQMISNADGTVSFVDVTEYSQVGSNFGQAQINATNVAVNESADKNKIIDSKEDLLANTQAGMMAGALAVKEIRSELNEKIIAETVDFGVVQINSGSTAGLAIPAKDGYTIASATPYSNSGSESTQTNVITFVNAVSGAKKAFYKNTSSSAISNRLMVDIIYVKSN